MRCGCSSHSEVFRTRRISHRWLRSINNIAARRCSRILMYRRYSQPCTNDHCIAPSMLYMLAGRGTISAVTPKAGGGNFSRGTRFRISPCRSLDSSQLNLVFLLLPLTPQSRRLEFSFPPGIYTLSRVCRTLSRNQRHFSRDSRTKHTLSKWALSLFLFLFFLSLYIVLWAFSCSCPLLICFFILGVFSLLRRHSVVYPSPRRPPSASR